MDKKQLPYLLLSLAVFISDQATKLFIVKTMRLLEVKEIFPFLNMVYYRNIGSAFGLFKQLGNLFFISISLAAVVVIGLLLLKDRDSRAGLSLILGGAAGNLADRILHGYVIDFIEVHAGRHFWPAFNIADSALTIGMILLLVDAWVRGKNPLCKSTQ